MISVGSPLIPAGLDRRNMPLDEKLVGDAKVPACLRLDYEHTAISRRTFSLSSLGASKSTKQKLQSHTQALR